MKERMDKLGSAAPLEPRAHTSAFRLLEVPFLFISELQSSECGIHVCKPTGFLGGGQCPYAIRKLEVLPITSGKLSGALPKGVFHRLSDRLVVCGLFALMNLTAPMLPLIPCDIQKFANEKRKPAMPCIPLTERFVVALLNRCPKFTGTAFKKRMPPDKRLFPNRLK